MADPIATFARSVAEIDALLAAAQIGVDYSPKNTPPTIVVTKGEPPILVCVEPMMTMHWPAMPSGNVLAPTPIPVLGPVSRMAIALHLALTPNEAASVGMTADAAQVELMSYLRTTVQPKLEQLGLAVESWFDILPGDPRWGRP